MRERIKYLICLGLLSIGFTNCKDQKPVDRLVPRIEIAKKYASILREIIESRDSTFTNINEIEEHLVWLMSHYSDVTPRMWIRHDGSKASLQFILEVKNYDGARFYIDSNGNKTQFDNTKSYKLHNLRDKESD